MVMRVIADLHIHGKYSRATSEKMDIEEIERFAPLKGLNLVGTGDFTHPEWLRHLKDVLVEVPGTSLYQPLKAKSDLRFMITGEVSTVFTYGKEVKKIHHVIFTPSFETAEQIIDRLANYGNLKADGRPTLDMSAPQLVEEIMEISRDNVVIPAHAWTPWFSIFGAFAGFNSVEDCYQDMTRHIFAIETGLSSDPPMNWRLSRLDHFALVSNSDSHSSWPWRIGREANVFELEKFTYQNVIRAIKEKDPSYFRFTIETYPDYGKYHWTGHRNCGVSLPPQEAIMCGGLCPVCHRRLTKGVEERVEELADRPDGYKPPNTPGYKYLLPLSEIISTVIGVNYPGVQKVWEIYNVLVSRFGDEYTVLLETPIQAIAEASNLRIAEAISRVRDGRVKIIPGYDGVYGQIVIFPEDEKANAEHREKGVSKQKSLSDFV
ncbi:MAG: endonuclease Q family protein [Nitrososphaerota archaeon]|nr:endonuclease Q family protein [Candidatus Bathyarchaeota archaeon]MDW8049107.1 endonuclease Q family protein [Nitrososphaerota archaeon]